jgi:hypothetical protein
MLLAQGCSMSAKGLRGCYKQEKTPCRKKRGIRRVAALIERRYNFL